MAESLPPGLSRETTIRRDAEGQWFHDGEPVTNRAVARAFDRWLERADDGRWILKNSVNWAYIDLEGPAFFVRRGWIAEEGVELELRGGRRVPLDPATLAHDEEGRMRCRVDGLLAVFERSAMLDLAEHLDEEAGGWILRLEGGSFPIPPDPA